jgi:hypothetical protein
MIKTSNFDTHARVHFKNAVSIAIYPAKGYAGRAYSKLAPPQDLKDRWYAGKVTREEFAIEYRRRVLRCLNPVVVAAELGDDAVLLCHEEPGTFCHRHLVAEWLSEHGIKTEEYSENRSLTDWF